MTISTYAELQTAFDNWLDHTNYQARSPEFITLFEAWVNRELRVYNQLTTTVLTFSDGSASLPSNFLEVRRATRNSNRPQDLDYAAPDYLAIVYPDQAASIDQPRSTIANAFYTIENDTIQVRPKEDNSTVTLLYYAKVPALATTATTNWLLTNHPDIYLFGALVESTMFGFDDPRGANWGARRNEALESIKKLDRSRKGAGRMQTRGNTP